MKENLGKKWPQVSDRNTTTRFITSSLSGGQLPVFNDILFWPYKKPLSLSMSPSEALLVPEPPRPWENAGFEVRERWGKTTKKDGGADWRGNLFHNACKGSIFSQSMQFSHLWLLTSPPSFLQPWIWHYQNTNSGGELRLFWFFEWLHESETDSRNTHRVWIG